MPRYARPAARACPPKHAVPARSFDTYLVLSKAVIEELTEVAVMHEVGFNERLEWLAQARTQRVRDCAGTAAAAVGGREC